LGLELVPALLERARHGVEGPSEGPDLSGPGFRHPRGQVAARETGGSPRDLPNRARDRTREVEAEEQDQDDRAAEPGDADDERAPPGAPGSEQPRLSGHDEVADPSVEVEDDLLERERRDGDVLRAALAARRALEARRRDEEDREPRADEQRKHCAGPEHAPAE